MYTGSFQEEGADIAANAVRAARFRAGVVTTVGVSSLAGQNRRLRRHDAAANRAGTISLPRRAALLLPVVEHDHLGIGAPPGARIGVEGGRHR